MIEEKVLDLIKFRLAMKEDITYSKSKSIWGKKVIEELDKDILKRLNKSTKGRISQIVTEKILIAKQNVKFLKVFDWVKFIAISGSVAAGFAKEQDDIDIYVVVRNHTAWIYRGILTIRNIFNHRMRSNRDGNNVKDLFCINFISEERGLKIDNDIFNFHELMYMVPIDSESEKYLPFIFSKNLWLVEGFGISKELVKNKVREGKNVNIILRFINWAAYIAQVVFMVLAGHKPEIGGIKGRYKEGRIEFFPKGFKSEVLKKV